MRTAFIGLGVMGFPMAGHLAKAGHDVVVYNRTAGKARQWTEDYRGRSAATPADAANGAEFIFSCVGNDDDVREVILGESGALAGADAGAIIVDHTTASATIARELHALAAARGVGFLDAPVSGGQAGAENGQLTVMAGGDKADFEKALPVIDSYAKAVTRIGPVGAGQLAKMVNQICIAGLVQGLSEGLHFAKRAGLDPAVVIESISQGAAQSWQMDNRWQTMVAGQFDFGFAVDWMRKDLGIALEEARKNGSTLSVTELVDRYYAEVQAMGGTRRIEDLRSYDHPCEAFMVLLFQTRWPRSRGRHRVDIPGCGPVLADGQPLANDGCRSIRLRVCRRLDAQGPWHRA